MPLSEARKAYAREYMRKQRAANPDKFRARTREWMRKWRAENPGVAQKRQRDWTAANPDRYAQHKRNGTIRRRGLEPQEYADLLSKQKGLCAACGKRMKSPQIDHDHTTGVIGGRVRGLLCSGCNTALGRVGDSIETLEALIAYLKRTY